MTHLADGDRFDKMLAPLDAGRVSGHENRSDWDVVSAVKARTTDQHQD